MKKLRLKEVWRTNKWQTRGLNSHLLIPTAAITSPWHMISDQKLPSDGGKETGQPSPLSCQELGPRGEPLPSLSSPGQDLDTESQKNKDHISSAKQGSQCWRNKGLFKIKQRGLRGDKSWVPTIHEWQPAVFLLLQRSLKSMCARPTFPTHLSISSPPPTTELQENSLIILPLASHLLFHSNFSFA